jgi:hypothetical protein
MSPYNNFIKKEIISKQFTKTFYEGHPILYGNTVKLSLNIYEKGNKFEVLFRSSYELSYTKCEFTLQDLIEIRDTFNKAINIITEK